MNELTTEAPARGFPESEYRSRLARAQAMMARVGLDAILLTTHPDIYYFTGFLTRFWESPTRPWYLVLPQTGAPVAVIPSIGEPLMASTWLSDIRTWPAPMPDDDGISLLAATLRELQPERVGIPAGHETLLRMPVADFGRLQTELGNTAIVGDHSIVSALRQLKSDTEITKIAHACQIAERAFSRVPEIAFPGTPLADIFRRFQILCLEEGADWVPYLAGGSGPTGYADVISPATSEPLAQGDVLMLDTGLVWDGYFCDFDRNFAIGTPTPEITACHAQLIEATAAAYEMARPGQTASDLFRAMEDIVGGGTDGADSGRLGHGLGIQLTEQPSLMASDHTILQTGMVLTLEPVVATRDGCIMVHEENIVITETGARYLTSPIGAEIKTINAH